MCREKRRPRRSEYFVHSSSIALASAYALGALIFGLYVIVANWRDYGHILAPRQQVPKADTMLESAAPPEGSNALAEATAETPTYPQPIEPMQQLDKP